MSSALRHDLGPSFPTEFDGSPGWDDLTADEQDLLLAASTEDPLWAVCERFSGPDLMVAAARVVGAGLIWLYRMDLGYPDLTSAEVAAVCSDVGWWERGGAGCTRVGMYLTEAGEAAFPSFPEPVGS